MESTDLKKFAKRREGRELEYEREREKRGVKKFGKVREFGPKKIQERESSRFVPHCAVKINKLNLDLKD